MKVLQHLLCAPLTGPWMYGQVHLKANRLPGIVTGTLEPRSKEHCGPWEKTGLCFAAWRTQGCCSASSASAWSSAQVRRASLALVRLHGSDRGTCCLRGLSTCLNKFRRCFLGEDGKGGQGHPEHHPSGIHHPCYQRFSLSLRT